MTAAAPPLRIALVVHPIDERSSPGAGGMWRWAVHLDDRDFGDQNTCLTAGAQPTRDDAALIGSQVAVAAARVAELCGRLEIPKRTLTDLDHDPCGEPWTLTIIEEF